MVTLETIDEVREVLDSVRASGKRVGFVPTMGALHDGHLSLVKLSQLHAGYTVMSIFVNPMQFNSSVDLAKYPRMLASDLEKAAGARVDLVFAPGENELYPRGVPSGATAASSAFVRAGDRSLPLEGASRPGHFDGVTTVVSKLFNIVRPDVAVFGEKDYQQVKVIEQLVQDLCFPVRVLTGPIVREPDGLALSSRNLRLSAEERYHALYIPRSLEKAREMVAAGETRSARLVETVCDNLERSGGLRIDYVAIVNVDSLLPVETIEDEAQLLVAAYAGDIRLIDNVRLVRRAGG